MGVIVSDGDKRERERLILINGLNICGKINIRIDNSIDSTGGT